VARRIRGVPAGYLHSAAGTWRGSGRSGPLRRIPSPPIGDYQTLITTIIGNDGIAFPATFTAAGVAQAQVGPQGIGASWEPAQASIYTSVGALDIAQASIFQGPLPIAQYQVASALQGGGAQIPLGGLTMVPGWFIYCVWTGGTPGALAFLTVSGSRKALVN
jgi:hypothetical protein